VKQVAFPLEVLAVRVTLPAFLTMVVGFGIILGKQAIEGSVSPLWPYVPALALLLVLNCIGFALLLGALGVFVRDIKDVVQFLLFVGIYISPIFYTFEAAPDLLKIAMYTNPFSSIILSFQDAIFYGTIVHQWAWIANGVVSVVVFTVGSRVFTATQHYFGNYL
jgi:lipopolysaccharide transport system permease protein